VVSGFRSRVLLRENPALVYRKWQASTCQGVHRLSTDQGSGLSTARVTSASIRAWRSVLRGDVLIVVDAVFEIADENRYSNDRIVISTATQL